MMKVRILIEFDVESLEDEEEDEDEFTENVAKGAASQAAWDHLTLSRNGVNLADDVEVHVDGFGRCRVKVGEAHE